MSDLGAGELSFRPSRARYWIVGPILTIGGLFFLALLAFSASLIADGFHGVSIGGGAIFPIVMGAGVVWTCAVFTSYMRNAAAVTILIDEHNINIKTWNDDSAIKISDIEIIYFLNSVRGWMYIAFYTESRPYAVSNLMYFDNQFEDMKSRVSNHFARIGKADLICSGEVSRLGIARNKKLPPFIYSGIWKCISAYSLILIAITVSCLVTGFRPAALLTAH